MALVIGTGCLGLVGLLPAQEKPAEPPAEAPAAEPPPVPKGVEVLARGPVHEAFATPTAEAGPTKTVPKQPPQPIEELPPDEKPEGDVLWISGYWAWDDDKADFLWVSGIWRTPPPHKRWVPGYWRASGQEWQWVPGFWSETARAESASQDVTYYPAPPAPPQVAPPGPPPAADTFYVPGSWVWNGEAYAWRAGYWAQVQPGYVWVNAHYVWAPNGFVFVPGYWDLAIAKRGVLFAPVYVDTVVVGPRFVYRPAYVVSGTVVVDALFVRPSYGHYYFGDYYGPAYRTLGFESCVVYSRRNYDAIFVYSSWEHRADPGWTSVQLDICLARHAGRAPVPPRTLVQQNLVVQQNITNVTNVTNITNNTTNVTNNVTRINAPTVTNNQVLVPASKLSTVTGTKTVPLDQAAKTQALTQAKSLQQVVAQRQNVETAAPSGNPGKPHQAQLTVPAQQPVGPRPSSVKLLAPPTAGPGTTSAAHGPTTPTAPHAATSAAAGAPPGKSFSPPPDGPHPPNSFTAHPAGAAPGHPGSPRPAAGKGPLMPLHPKPMSPPPRPQPGHPAPPEKKPPEQPSKSN
jgi:hypothetical protein